MLEGLASFITTHLNDNGNNQRPAPRRGISLPDLRRWRPPAAAFWAILLPPRDSSHLAAAFWALFAPAARNLKKRIYFRVKPHFVFYDCWFSPFYPVRLQALSSCRRPKRVVIFLLSGTC